MREFPLSSPLNQINSVKSVKCRLYAMYFAKQIIGASRSKCKIPETKEPTSPALPNWSNG